MSDSLRHDERLRREARAIRIAFLVYVVTMGAALAYVWLPRVIAL